MIISEKKATIGYKKIKRVDGYNLSILEIVGTSSMLENIRLLIWVTMFTSFKEPCVFAGQNPWLFLLFMLFPPGSPCC